MKPLLKNWSSHIKRKTISSIKLQGALCCFLYFSLTASAQIANYVNNGGFEECGNCVNWVGGTLSAKYWTAFDTSQFSYGMFSELPPSQQVPQNGNTWQWPKSGYNYIIGTVSFPGDTITKLTYPRNILKQSLQAGKTYCVKFYVNISNSSTYGIDGFGAYLGDDNLDTITQYSKPLSYLTPQIQNPSGNAITDTLNWTLISGTFTANGTEKYLVLGNFKSYSTTTSVLVNSTYLPQIFTDALFDDVSCIDIDLPAFAGYDYYKVPGDSAFIGRTPDVGINEACTWYQLPNMATPIATIAGMYVKPAVTTTYVVRQEICGIVKWDTVVVFQSAVGIEKLEDLSQKLNVYPVPANDELFVEFSNPSSAKEFTKAEILNTMGQIIKTVDLQFNGGKTMIVTTDLLPGSYFLRLRQKQSASICKRFVITQ